MNIEHINVLLFDKSRHIVIKDCHHTHVQDATCLDKRNRYHPVDLNSERHSITLMAAAELMIAYSF